jgi:hypothetical protein
MMYHKTSHSAQTPVLTISRQVDELNRGFVVLVLAARPELAQCLNLFGHINTTKNYLALLQ